MLAGVAAAVVGGDQGASSWPFFKLQAGFVL